MKGNPETQTLLHINNHQCFDEKDLQIGSSKLTCRKPTEFHHSGPKKSIEENSTWYNYQLDTITQ
jgi:hypothetical protein